MAYNWTYKRIGDVCTVERGGSPRPIDTFITDSNDGINWIKIGDADDSMYITKTEQKINYGWNQCEQIEKYHRPCAANSDPGTVYYFCRTD